MDLKDIKLLIRLVEEKQFTEFELETGDFKLRIKRGETPAIHYVSSPPAMMPDTIPTSTSPGRPPSALTATAARPALSPESEDAESALGADLHVITSPIVGTFYCAPSPTSPPFVQVGDRVEIGTILCIVEAMKLMNEIPSDVAGQIVKVFVENGQPIEYGQPLFSIKVG